MFPFPVQNGIFRKFVTAAMNIVINNRPYLYSNTLSCSGNEMHCQTKTINTHNIIIQKKKKRPTKVFFHVRVCEWASTCVFVFNFCHGFYTIPNKVCKASSTQIATICEFIKMRLHMQPIVEWDRDNGRVGTERTKEKIDSTNNINVKCGWTMYTHCLLI